MEAENKNSTEMLKRVFGILCLVNLDLAYGTDSCQTYVCLNWRVTLDELKLTCKVSQLHYKVLILNQFGMIQAACIPPTPFSKCDPYYRNATISQNPETNETTFTVRGHIDYHINGIWTCRHGRHRQEARIEVTVLRIQEKYNITKFKENKNSSCIQKSILQVIDTSCITNVLLTATVSYLVSVSLSLMLLTCVKTGWREIDNVCRKVSGCIICDMKISTKTLVCKRIAFVIFSGLYETVAVICSLIEKENCVVKWSFIAFGLILGGVNSFTFLSNVDIMDEETDTKNAKKDVHQAVVYHNANNEVNTDSIDEQTDPKNAKEDVTQATDSIDEQTDPKNANKDVTKDSIDEQTDPKNAKEDVTQVSTVVIAAHVHNNANTDVNPATDSIEQTDPNDTKKDVTEDLITAQTVQNNTGTYINQGEEIENENHPLISFTA